MLSRCVRLQTAGTFRNSGDILRDPLRPTVAPEPGRLREVADLLPGCTALVILAKSLDRLQRRQTHQKRR